MRDIKFRAWDPTTKRMIKSEHVLNHWYRFYNQFKTVMQYTGLKDKNGVEIYEGDIIYIQTVDNTDYKSDVVFSDGVYFISDAMLLDVHNVCIVIGNIFENPALLRRKL